ncbi:zinc ribbon domain-containing protein [Thiocapsa roseopersicina]|nr:zinc ribbon domain-containing protein [Thiocapsa roseopersicina]
MILDNEKMVRYLMNVIGLARADNSLSPRESGAIEFVQTAIGARKTELNKAYKMVEDHAFTPEAVGAWSDQIKNLEHIIYVALIDGSIDENEKLYILNFAKQVKISQEQLNVIISDVKTSIAATTQEIKCPGCGASIAATAKFCPQCGANVVVAEADQSVAVSYEIPTNGVAIEFAESSSANFGMAVKAMREAPVNGECIRAKKQWYMACWPRSNIADAFELVNNLKGQRNRKVYLDGEERQWNDVFDFVNCANARKAAYRPNEYCFGIDEKRLNIWGCRKAGMDWNEWSSWFGYGAYSKTGMLGRTVVFTFDKSRIRHELETSLHSCQLCPHLRFDLIEAVLEEIPEQVTPSQNGDWRYKRDYNEAPGAIEVKEVSRSGGMTFTNEYYSSGVSPASVYVGLEILKRAFQRCQVPKDISAAVLEYKE